MQPQNNFQKIEFAECLLRVAQVVLDKTNDTSLSSHLVSAAQIAEPERETKEYTWFSAEIPTNTNLCSIRKTTNGVALWLSRGAAAAALSGRNLRYDTLWISRKLTKETADGLLRISAPWHFKWKLYDEDHDSIEINSEDLLRIVIMAGGRISVEAANT